MTTPDASRLDLYTGLVEVLGPKRADTLMAHLPTAGSGELATRADVQALGESLRGELVGLSAALRAEMAGLSEALRAEMAGIRTELAGIRADLVHTNQRIDRLFITLVAGLFTIVAAMAGVVTATLL